MYHSGEDYDKILDCLVKIANVVNEMDGVKMPHTKTVIVRICSEYGIETGIADARKEDVILRIEDTLYGKIYPRLGWEPDGCKYYREDVGIAPQCPHPTPPLAMFGCEKPILRPCTNSFNIHN
jgi:hypothetical protein